MVEIQEKLQKIQLIETAIRETKAQLNSWIKKIENYSIALKTLENQTKEIKNKIK